MKNEAVKKLGEELNDKAAKWSLKAGAVKKAVYDALAGFCVQNEEFAQAVAQSEKTLWAVCEEAVKNVGTSVSDLEVCALAVGVMIRYENGAEVRTSFLTNMDAAKVRTAPGLYKAVEDAVERGREKKPELPVYDLPDNVITAARIQKYAHYGIEFAVPCGQAHFVRSIGAMGKKSLFGAGFLISDKAAADKAAEKKAIKYELNAREREIVRILGEARGNDD